MYYTTTERMLPNDGEIEPGSGFSSPSKYVGVSFFLCWFFNWRDYSSFLFIFLFFVFFRENNKGFETKNGLEMTWILRFFVPFGFDRNCKQRNLAADGGTGRCDRSARCGVVECTVLLRKTCVSLKFFIVLMYIIVLLFTCPMVANCLASITTSFQR